jgi:hypothetical protein
MRRWFESENALHLLLVIFLRISIIPRTTNHGYMPILKGSLLIGSFRNTVLGQLGYASRVASAV